MKKVPEDEKAHELSLYKATRARMTCQRANKNQVNIPCTEKCQELIENLGPNTPNFPFSKVVSYRLTKTYLINQTKDNKMQLRTEKKS